MLTIRPPQRSINRRGFLVFLLSPGKNNYQVVEQKFLQMSNDRPNGSKVMFLQSLHAGHNRV